MKIDLELNCNLKAYKFMHYSELFSGLNI